MIDPTGSFACITSSYENNVSVLDLRNRKVVASVVTGEGPNGISFNTVLPKGEVAKELQLPMQSMMVRESHPVRIIKRLV
ncbi:MAG TPA: hypothetical protein VHP14_18660 [Anaerolineales bacterium]|nr:hypothetical protein [Anaerolineales bacterium]